MHVFDLADNPKAPRAYAWSSPIEGSIKRRFFAVLRMGAIDSPVAAVRATIVQEHRSPPQFNEDAMARGLRNLPGRKDRE